ncbi:RNA polymerase I general transcription initiation factor subunit Rrn7 [Schizosaccharomyces pombe]|uniref:RNA polymerase I-specific transcription initiation factor rrn7 n=1 Tax=Schizosaccharomyces pombe (strain 972 / ATCC 24843) TaxID=284812 RepID=RRN7_SCHPO|nr:RNA polymerase I upstream activation factor complex subunit Rrn7 [Schizosaccharomyces pombe]Q9UST5.1 RecName: Full=RNA polymerase I-specific transcription initiation factor rrn7 [Schizosaccharomyces pombe 972h-]CAB58161.1 RNA polymerase I upstream activation factor complex subunit Rrn7 [Schizosaccharomyces pombe]|eukprot:NP_596129.1 RNA polymerase I upstream activation factor complex subunit Rrn7 [Schizosaccharomyces pombe]
MEGNWFEGPPCSVRNCKSTWYFKNAGQTFCRRGHAQHGIEIAQDDEPGAGTFYQTRKRKVVRNHLDTGDEDEIVYGTAGRSLYLQAFQIILQLQCQALTTKLGFDQRIEGMIRDLWALYLSLSYESFTSSFLSLNQNSTQSESSDSDFDLIDPESQPGADPSSRKTKETSQSHSISYPRLLYSSAFIYVACLLLRLPLTIHKLEVLIRKNIIPYYRAYKQIPLKIFKRLQKNYVRMLIPFHYPTYQRIQSAVLTLVDVLVSKYELKVPPPNEPLILFELINSFFFPLEIFIPASRLLNLVHSQISLQGTSSDNYQSKIRSAQSIHEKLSDAEVMLLATILVAANVCYGFDDAQTRNSKYKDSMFTVKTNWNMWLSQVQKINEKEKDKFYEIDEQSILTLNNSEMDKYFQWYEKEFVEENNPNNIPEGILNVFPILSKDSHLQENQPTDILTDESVIAEDVKLEQVFKPVGIKESDKMDFSRRKDAYISMLPFSPNTENTAHRVTIMVAKLYNIKLDSLIAAIRYVESCLKTGIHNQD